MGRRQSLILVRPGERFLALVQEVSEDESFTLEELRADSTAYLVPAVEAEAELEEVLRECASEIFERELADWIQDSERWPAYRGYDEFREWFAVELATTVVDLDD